MNFYLIILCIGSTSPLPVQVPMPSLKACQREAAKAAHWPTMLYRCETHCIDATEWGK